MRPLPWSYLHRWFQPQSRRKLTDFDNRENLFTILVELIFLSSLFNSSEHCISRGNIENCFLLESELENVFFIKISNIFPIKSRESSTKMRNENSYQYLYWDYSLLLLRCEWNFFPTMIKVPLYLQNSPGCFGSRRSYLMKQQLSIYKCNKIIKTRNKPLIMINSQKSESWRGSSMILQLTYLRNSGIEKMVAWTNNCLVSIESFRGNWHSISD